MKVILQAIKSLLKKLEINIKHDTEEKVKSVKDDIQIQLYDINSRATEIIDVVELPTEHIKDCFYRVTSEAVFCDWISSSAAHRYYMTYICVDALPENPKEYIPGINNYKYLDVRNWKVMYFRDGRWKNDDDTYQFVHISDEMPLGEDCVVVNTKMYAHRGGAWVELSSDIVRSGDGEQSTVLNSFENVASGRYSHAEGCNTTASGDDSHAEGGETIASGEYSHAEGWITTASGRSSHAEGYHTRASGSRSHAEGDWTIASGTFSHAEGERTEASGECSHAEGKCTTALSAHQHVQGKYNIEDPDSKYAHIVGNGTGLRLGEPSNAHTLDWNGNAWFQGDVYVGGTSQDNGERLARLSDIPSSGGGDSNSPAIIDVVELPAENIQGDKFYRLLSGKFIANTIDQGNTYVHCVKNLPQTGIPATDAEQTSIHAYYNVADGEAYGYIDDILSIGVGVPAGWYPAAMLFEAFGYPYAGVITDLEDDPNDGSFRILLNKDMYVHDVEWNRLIYAYEKPPKFDITWDGEIGDRFALDLSPLGYEGVKYVKVSDDVFEADQIIGATWHQKDGFNYTVDIESIDFEMFPGALVANGIVIVYSADDTNSALGLPTGYITNGTYFIYDASGGSVNYTDRFVAKTKVITIPSEFLDLENGFATVARSGSYYDLLNRPEVYTDVVRYGVTQNLASYYKNLARNNIDVYSKSEVDNKIANVSPSVDLSAYATKEYVDSLIGSAIGGSY